MFNKYFQVVSVGINKGYSALNWSMNDCGSFNQVGLGNGVLHIIFTFLKSENKGRAPHATQKFN